MEAVRFCETLLSTHYTATHCHHAEGRTIVKKTKKYLCLYI